MSIRPLLAVAVVTLSAWTLTAAAAQTYFRGSAEDPSVRSARFLGEDQRFLSAITELRKLQRHVREMKKPEGKRRFRNCKAKADAIDALVRGGTLDVGAEVRDAALARVRLRAAQLLARDLLVRHRLHDVRPGDGDFVQALHEHAEVLVFANLRPRAVRALAGGRTRVKRTLHCDH